MEEEKQEMKSRRRVRAKTSSNFRRTARSLGVQDSFDARQNVFGATKYLRTLLDRFHGNLDMTLAAYNAGPELVAKAGPSATEGA